MAILLITGIGPVFVGDARGKNEQNYDAVWIGFLAHIN